MPDEYDPNDEQYLSTAERLSNKASESYQHAKKWFGNVGNDLVFGAPVFGTGVGLSAIGKGLSKVPFAPVKALGVGAQGI